jgi:hypothetical protein
MKKRVVFSVDDMAGARVAMDQLRKVGIADQSISLVARSDKSDMIPDDRKIVEGDFYPAAAKGAAGGAALGLVAGLAAVAIPPLGITFAGALAMAVGGSVLGAWSTALSGSAVDDPVRRQFEDEVEAGRILVVVDAEEEQVALTYRTMVASGAKPLPFEKPTAIT